MIWLLVAAGVYFVYRAQQQPVGGDPAAGIPNGQSYGQNPGTIYNPGAQFNSDVSPFTTPGNVPQRPTAFYGTNFLGIRSQAGAVLAFSARPATTAVIPPGGVASGPAVEAMSGRGHF